MAAENIVRHFLTDYFPGIYDQFFIIGEIFGGYFVGEVNELPQVVVEIL